MATDVTSSTTEPLTRALDASDRFRPDSGIGRIYHRGTASYRELCATDSLHIVIDGTQVSVHVDRVSPLKFRADGSVRYSLTRIVAHNLVGMHDQVVRRPRRRPGRHRPEVGRKIAARVLQDQP